MHILGPQEPVSVCLFQASTSSNTIRMRLLLGGPPEINSNGILVVPVILCTCTTEVDLLPSIDISIHLTWVFLRCWYSETLHLGYHLNSWLTRSWNQYTNQCMTSSSYAASPWPGWLRLRYVSTSSVEQWVRSLVGVYTRCTTCSLVIMITWWPMSVGREDRRDPLGLLNLTSRKTVMVPATRTSSFSPMIIIGVASSGAVALSTSMTMCSSLTAIVEEDSSSSVSCSRLVLSDSSCL